MKKLLFVNCCIRKNSRTEKLCRRYLEELGKQEEFELQEINAAKLDIAPFDEEMLEQRERDIAQGRTDTDKYRLAHAFAAADMIVIGAPYWDCSFPSKLKVYFEHVCVAGITFDFNSDGEQVKLCRANSLVYITTSGGYLRSSPGVERCIKDLASLFEIGDARFYCAQGLDVFPDKVEEILDKTLEDMLGI